MQVYHITIEERVRRTLTVAAVDAQQAHENAAILLKPNAKVIDITPCTYTLEASATDALAHLVSQDWLAWEGKDQCIADWLIRAQAPATRVAANAKLGLAGLRLVDDDGVIIASPGSVPALHRWFNRTPWQGGNLFATLLRLKGVSRVEPRSFCGVQSRGVKLPFGLLVAA